MSCVIFFIYALLASLLLVNASPVPFNETTPVDLDKRTDHWGRGTWFYVGHGNCGQWNVDSDPIVAISKQRYDSNGGANCGQWVEIINTQNGKRAFGLTRDSCESCTTEDLDMSPSLFQQLAPLDVGQIKIQWHFMSKSWSP